MRNSKGQFIKGYKMTEDHKKKIGTAHKGKTPKNFLEIQKKAWIINKGRKPSETAFKKRNIPYNKGQKRPELSGENHPNWRGGKNVWPKCSDCGKIRNKYKNKTGKCFTCFLKNAVGENALHWKGGINSTIKRRAMIENAIGDSTPLRFLQFKKTLPNHRFHKSIRTSRT